MWVANDLISRCRSLDFTPSDVNWGVLRLIIAIPMGYAFTSVIKQDFAPFMTFALGAFPLATINSLIQRKSYKYLDLEAKSEGIGDGITQLQGADPVVIERLANEDIRTIAHLAYCDPVHISMRSNLNFNFITDLMNQALVSLYLKDSVSKLTPLGFRGAVEVRHFLQDLDPGRYLVIDQDEEEDVCEESDEPDADVAAAGDQARREENADIGSGQDNRDETSDEDNSGEIENKKTEAEELLSIVAMALGQDPRSTRNVFENIGDDPYAVFLYEIWT